VIRARGRIFVDLAEKTHRWSHTDEGKDLDIACRLSNY